LRTNEWKTNPLITITIGVRGAIHKQGSKRVAGERRFLQNELQHGLNDDDDVPLLQLVRDRDEACILWMISVTSMASVKKQGNFRSTAI
jgi:hypothetical protein